MKSKHTHLYTCLGNVINLRRKRLKMSQEELAADSGVNRPFISNVEKGKRNPSIGVLASLAAALKMRTSRLLAKCEQCLDEREKGKRA